MAIRIGSTPPRPSRSTAMLPQSRGMSNIAQRKIDQLAVMAARRTAEAVRVDGWPVHVWVRNSQATIQCSCRAGSTIEPQTNLDISPEAGEVGPVEGADRPSVFMDREPGALGISWNGRGVDAGGFSSNVLGDTTPEFFAPGSKIVSGDGRTPTQIVPTTEFTELDGELVANQTAGAGLADDNWDEAFASLFPFINDATPCLICGGTGKVNSLRYVSGIRFLLRASDPYMEPKLSLAEVDRTKKPHVFRFIKKTGTVEWTWTIPPYFESIAAVRIRSNEDTLPLDLQVYSGGSWVTFASSYVDALKGTGGALRLRVIGSEIEEFTHVELLLRTVQAPYAQFPQLQRDTGGDTVEALVQSDFEIDPEVGFLTRGTLIEVPDMGRVFLVTTVTNKITSKKFLFGVTGNVRVVQPTEALAKFGLVLSWQGADNLPYRGSEPSIRARAGIPPGSAAGQLYRNTRPSTTLPTTNTPDKAG